MVRDLYDKPLTLVFANCHATEILDGVGKGLSQLREGDANRAPNNALVDVGVRAIVMDDFLDKSAFLIIQVRWETFF